MNTTEFILFYFHSQPSSGSGACMCAKSLQLCLTLCDPMDCGLPGSSAHGILQARILECVAMPPPGNLPNPGIQLESPALQKILYHLSHQGNPSIT